MTIALSGTELAAKLAKQFQNAVIESDETSIRITVDSLREIASFLKKTPEFDFNYLTAVTAVDYRDYFEVVYILTSITHNHSLTLKVRVENRQNPVLPSVVAIWWGADLQEQEIFDLMGITFEGHPNMKRIFLWDGFPGYPQRKDWENAG